MKQAIQQAVKNNAVDILDLSHKIHANPELGFAERQAVAWQIELLKRHGFHIECPYCGIETAYRATFRGKGKGPRIAFLAEYDALRGLGHGCGHNIIAASAVGAGIGLASILQELDGEIVVMGTPAEESGGGKILLVDRGAFDDIDYAIMMHPSTNNLIGRGGLAAVSLEIEYFGKAAHSAAPEQGVNALTSLIRLFTGIDVLRQTWKADAKVNGFISAGGKASNIIPDYAAAEFTVRAKTRKYLLSLVDDIRRAADAAALLTGAKVKFTTGLVYAERYSNLTMGETFKKNMESLGEIMGYPRPDEILGSSDIGNVSLVVPAIHEYLAIAPDSVNSHSADFCQAAVSHRADEVVIKAAQGMAMTAFDILSDSKLRQNIIAEYREQVAAAR